MRGDTKPTNLEILENAHAQIGIYRNALRHIASTCENLQEAEDIAEWALEKAEKYN